MRKISLCLMALLAGLVSPAWEAQAESVCHIILIKNENAAAAAAYSLDSVTKGCDSVGVTLFSPYFVKVCQPVTDCNTTTVTVSGLTIDFSPNPTFVRCDACSLGSSCDWDFNLWGDRWELNYSCSMGHP